MKKYFLGAALACALLGSTYSASAITIKSVDYGNYAVNLSARSGSSYGSNDFFTLNVARTPSNRGLHSMSLDISPADAFFDINSNKPGSAFSPLMFGELNGVKSSEISYSVNDGESLLNLTFKPFVFTPGDSIKFGIDMDPFSIIDGTTSAWDLINGGSKVTFSFYDNSGNTHSTPTPVPEPTSMALGAMGLAGFLGLRRKKNK